MLHNPACCLPVRIEWVFECNTSGNPHFQEEERLILSQVCVFCWGEETHLSLHRKPSVSEVKTLTTLLHSVNELLLERNISWKSELSRWRDVHFLPNKPIDLKVGTHLSLERKWSVLEREKCLDHCFRVRIDLVLKGILTANPNFQGGERVIFLKWASLSGGKKHMYPSKENHLC